MTRRTLQYGMVGGGAGSFIGAVHRTAIQMEGDARLVAGVFSADHERSRAFGRSLGLEPERVYGTYEHMVQQESCRDPSTRLDFVAIVAPTRIHVPAAMLFLESGFNVVCEKPLATNLAEAEAVEAAASRMGKVFVLTHNYTGNAMVKHARELVRDGCLGAIRKVAVEYLQGWKSLFIESRDRTSTDDGGTGCLAEIGSHAHNLLRYVTGLSIEKVSADVTTMVAGRKAHDDAVVLLRFPHPARGVLHCSQVALGEENNLNIRVYGERASLQWFQESPNELIVGHHDRPAETRRRGNSYSGRAACQFSRLPPGHPEGYLEAFANLYREAFRAIHAQLEGRPLPLDLDLPAAREGLEGMRFVAAALQSARDGGAWLDLLQAGDAAEAAHK